MASTPPPFGPALGNFQTLIRGTCRVQMSRKHATDYNSTKQMGVMYSTGQNSFGVILYSKPWAHPPTNHYLVCLDKCGNFFLENKAPKPSPYPSSTSAQSSPSDEHGILSPRQSQGTNGRLTASKCLQTTSPSGLPLLSPAKPTSSDRTNGRPSLLPKARRHPSHGHNKAAVTSVKTWEQSGSSNKIIIKNRVKNRKDIQPVRFVVFDL